MNILEVFFWFCKKEKIMGLVLEMYQMSRIGYYSEKYGTISFERTSMHDFLKNRLSIHCLAFLFDDILFRMDISNSNKFIQNSKIDFEKLSNKWAKFCKNNIKLSEDYVKVGDTIEIGEVNYKVKSIPKNFTGYVEFEYTVDGNTSYTRKSIFSENLKINGEEKEPKFYIKQNRKVYGLNKR